jgi:hypothetical protein
VVTVLVGSRYGQVRPVEPVHVEPGTIPDLKPGSDGPGPGGGTAHEPTAEEAKLADAVRRAVADKLGVTEAKVIQVLVDRPGQPRR